MIGTVFTAEKFQAGARLSGYIAELSSCFVCADLGISPELEPRPDHASYLQSWLEVLSNDKRAIFQAAAHAQRAVAYLHSLQPAVAEERGGGLVGILPPSRLAPLLKGRLLAVCFGSGVDFTAPARAEISR